MQKSDLVFEKILNFIVLFCASLFTVPLSLILFTVETRPVFEHAEQIMPAFAMLSTFFGYIIQALLAHLTGKQASHDGYSDNGNRTLTSFHVKHAILPIVLYLLIAVPIFFASNAAFEALFETKRMEYTNEIYGIVTAVLFVLSAVIGCVVWFYPVERLQGVQVITVCAVIFYAEMFFAALTVAPLFSLGLSVLSHPAVTKMIAPPLFLFTISLLLVYNQSNLQRKYHGSVVSVITPSARMYNLFLVFVFLLFFAVMFAVVYVLLKGVAILLDAVLYVIAFKLFYGQEAQKDPYVGEYVDSDEVSAGFRASVMTSGNQYLLSVFFLLLLAGAALFILGKTGKLKTIVQSIRTWFRNLLNSFLLGRDIFKHAGDMEKQDDLYNYRDEKKSTQHASIRDFDTLAEQTDTYRMFMTRLSRLKDYDEQVCYAYTVLLKMYKKMNISLKISDTPREVNDKVRRTLTPAEIQRITDDFERVHYSETTVSDIDAAAILTNLCETIKRYMY